MDQLATQVTDESSEEFWRGHILAAGEFKGSNTLYCRTHGLNHKIFSYHKSKLGFSRRKGRPKTFVEVKSKVEDAEKPFVRIGAKSSLPDARWLAEFAAALLLSRG